MPALFTCSLNWEFTSGGMGVVMYAPTRYPIIETKRTNSPITDINAKRLTPRREELIVGDLNAPQLYRLAGLDDEPKR